MKKSFAQNLLSFSFVSIVSFAIGFIATPIMTRLYDPNQLGYISLFQSAIGLLGVIVLGGQDQSYARFYYETNDKNKLISINLISVLFIWLLTTVITLLFARSISILLYSEINYYAVFLSVFCTLPNAIIRFSTQLCKMQENNKAYAFQVIVLSLLSKLGVIGIAFVRPTFNAWAFAYVIILTGLSILFSWMEIKGKKLKITKNITIKDTKQQLKFGLPLLVSSFCFTLIAWLPKTILNNSMGTFQVGIYASAITLASSINLIESGFNTYFGVYLYSNYKNDHGEISLIHHSITFISINATLILVFCGDFIIQLLGSKYNEAIYVFPFIVVANILLTISETTVYGINLKNKTHLHIIISVISALVCAFVSFLLCSEYGAIGAAIGYCIGMLTMFIMRSILGLKYFNPITDFWRTICGCIVLMAIPTVNWLMSNSGYVRWYIVIVIFVIIGMIYLPYFYYNRLLIKELL